MRYVKVFLENILYVLSCSHILQFIEQIYSMVINKAWFLEHHRH